MPKDQKTVEQGTAADDPLSEIDDDDLASWLMERYKNCRKDKEDFGWTAKMEYAEKAYNGYVSRNVMSPWKNAANYHVHLTRTLVDTAHANALGSIFADPENTVDVRGIGPEDVRKESALESLINFQVSNEIDAYHVADRALHLAFVQGVGIVKVVQDAEEGKVKWMSVPAENVFVPITARGFQVDQCDVVFEIIPLTENRYEDLLQSKDENGNPFLPGLEDVPKGQKMADSTAMQVLTNIRDAIFGTEKQASDDRDNRYIVETYATYWYQPKGSKPGETQKKKAELVVWFAPAISKVLRKRINKGKTWTDKKTGKTRTVIKRPYTLCRPDPRFDRFWGQGIPERLKQTQEELNYTHNQAINAADLAIRPVVLYPESQNIQPEDYLTAPGAWCPVPDPKAVEVLRIQADPVMERQEDRYWDLAERDTGLTELFQGRAPDPRQTLGANVIRQNKTEIRFKAVYLRIEQFWKELIELTYYYNSIYLPKDKMVKVLGTSDYKSVGELFPEGIEGNFDFGFSSEPLTEKEAKKQDTINFCLGMFTNPVVLSNPRSMRNITKLWAEAHGQRNIDGLVEWPPESSALGADEAIQRIVSGQDVVPSPHIDAEQYIVSIQMFMQSEAFTESDQGVQQRMARLLERVKAIREGQMQSALDAIILRARTMPRQQRTENGSKAKEEAKEQPA